MYLAIKDKPELISIAPNYIQKESYIFKNDKNCDLKEKGYEDLMAIINSKDIRIELNKMPNKYSVDYVKNTCKETIFSEKNLTEFNSRQEKLEK